MNAITYYHLNDENTIKYLRSINLFQIKDIIIHINNRLNKEIDSNFIVFCKNFSHMHKLKVILIKYRYKDFPDILIASFENENDFMNKIRDNNYNYRYNKDINGYEIYIKENIYIYALLF